MFVMRIYGVMDHLGTTYLPTYRYLDAVLAFVWDSIVFHDSIDITEAAGGLLIIWGCMVSIFARRISASLPQCSLTIPHRTRTTSSSSNTKTGVPA